jgi:O-antigen/teichoic acid export membrane protein
MEYRNNLFHRLLIRLQTLFQTDIRYLLQGTSYLAIGQGVAALSGFLLTVSLVRILDQAEYGLYSYILSLTGIIGIFTHSGMDTVVAQSVAKGFDRSIIPGFWSKITWSSPISFITICIGAYYLHNNNQILGYSLLIAGITTPLFAASTLYASYFNGKKQFKKLAYDNALKNIAISLSIIIVALYTHNVLYVVSAYFISSTLISVVRFFNLTKKLPTVSHENQPEDSLSIGKHLSMMEVFSNISTYIDKIIVFQLLGATSLALYALALAPIKQLQSASRIIKALVLPKFSTRSAKELKKSMSRKTLIFFLVSLAIAIMYCVGAQLFFTFFFPTYTEALRYSQVLSLSLLFMPLILHVQALTSLNKKRELYLIHIARSIIKIGLLVILVPLYGIWGAIYAFLLTLLITSILQLMLFQRMSTE